MNLKVFISLVFLLISGIAGSEEMGGDEVKEVAPESCNGPGRYQLVIHPSVRADQYLVDTCLGRVWRQKTYPELDKTIWLRVPRVDSEEELGWWALDQLLPVDKARVEAARADISTIEIALKFYRLDNFAYPSTEQGIEALVTKPNDPNIKNWSPGGYLERMPTDPWGEPYLYLNPGNNGEIDVFTLGADRAPGGEGYDADIGNWDLK